MLITSSGYVEMLPNANLEKRREYWELAKGLQKTDGLTTSAYLETLIADSVAGKYDIEQAEQRLYLHYTHETGKIELADDRTAEADFVSARITKLLEYKDFNFSPVYLCSIHKKLFADVMLSDWVGHFRWRNMVKPEPILCGATVKYGDWEMIEQFLSYEFRSEEQLRYILPFKRQYVPQLSRFVSKVWQIHPFFEGNTRTVATFLIKYLRFLGIEISNEPFRENSEWFRDALVRSVFFDNKLGVNPEFSYLNMFLENILGFASHTLPAIDLTS